MSEGCSRQVSQLCVSKVPFFNHLGDADMRRIVDKSTHQHFKKGETIYQANDPLQYLYIVHQGSVKIYQLFESGKEQLLRILEPGDFMGELALFTEKKLDSYAEALEKTDICMIHRSEMQQLLQDHPSIAIKILTQFSNRLEQTEKLVGELTAKDVETRLAGYILELADKTASTAIVLPMSKRDLASYLATTQETISRRLSHLQTNDIIQQRGHRRITIIDRKALSAIASGPDAV